MANKSLNTRQKPVFRVATTASVTTYGQIKVVRGKSMPTGKRGTKPKSH